jgi:hypothetical protein
LNPTLPRCSISSLDDPQQPFQTKAKHQYQINQGPAAKAKGKGSEHAPFQQQAAIQTPFCYTETEIIQMVRILFPQTQDETASVSSERH